MPNYQNPSETAKGKTEEFALQIARGHIPNHYHIHKFGAVPAMSQNQTGTIWDVNDTVYPWSAWATAGTVTVLAVNASDNGKDLILVGLDENFKEQTDTIVVSSSGTVTSNKSFIRLYRAYIDNGSATNVGDITVQKNSTTVLRIKAGKAQTLMAIYTIPADKTGYLIHGTCTCQSGADATGDMYVRYGGNEAFRVGHSFEVSGTGGQYDYSFGVPIPIPEKSDIDVRATVRSNNARITAAFDIILIDN
jgi:hypothetical protein